MTKQNRQEKMFNKVVFVINPIFGINRNSSKIIEWIEELWGNTGIEYEIIKTGHSGHGITLTQEAIAKGADMVVAVGGDGTINEVGHGLINSNSVLGVIPAGSGNGFARNFQIPLNQKEAIIALRTANLRKIDVGKINGFYFFNTAGAGLDAIISETFSRSKMRGPLTYYLVGVREFFKYEPKEVIINFDGKEIRRTPLLLSFANLPKFGINATIAPGACPDDGLIDLCVLNSLKFKRALVNLPKFFTGKIDQLPEMEIYQTKKIVVRRLTAGPIHIDGDARHADATLTIEILPKAITIAVPNKRFAPEHQASA